MSEYSKQALTTDLVADQDRFAEKLKQLRTGRAKPEMFNQIMVTAYGMDNQLQSLANVVIENALSVVIVPYDRSISNDITKAIEQAGLGLMPSNEGDKIRINIPPLTEERRKQTVKEMHALLEEARIDVRQTRQKYMDRVAKMESVSEDEQDRLKKEIQKEVDQANHKLQDMADKKEQDIMSV